MPTYQMNDAAFELPKEFADGTMHLFSTGNDPASKFTFVVTRAEMEAGDTVDIFVQRLVAQMRKTLPRFELKNIQVREIDGETAREVEYVWVSEGTPLHQRQTIVVAHGAGAALPRAISFIGTCPKQFSDTRNAQYKAMLESVTLKAASASFAASRLDASGAAIVFVLRSSDGSLRVVHGVQELFRHDIAEVLASDVAFFDRQGAPLALKIDPGADAGWRHRNGDVYALWTVDPAVHGPLLARLDEVRFVVGGGVLSDVDAVRAHLGNGLGPAPTTPVVD
ncbi:DcrB-related protein [Burkholderia sp. Ac-20379]|uniref:DcrB-related protein n=1 Tax=Burkholderia sp. Ac-20379 TaxID=2703900 RepID=UPI00197D2B7D|nr:DcrB-related protein [Burkholderia sp. Ac-20379]MBN3725671.1 DcrB-related protein [Burkholderia sp. Ac-20379]